MSKIKLEPNASGTGTLTVSAPNTNTDRTFTLPDETGTALTTESTESKVPVVNLIGDTQTSSSSSLSYKVITFNESSTVHIDSASIFNSSNDRVVPNVAGYYQFHFQAVVQDTSRFFILIYKNNAVTVAVMENRDDGNTFQRMTASSGGIAYFNGTDDYVDFRIAVSGTNKNIHAAYASALFIGRA